MAFPLSPANNQTALVNGIVYQWNAALGVWKRNGSINSANIGQLVLTSSQLSTSNGSGTLIVAGGAGITGNLYTGGVYITGSANGITFADGSTQTTAPNGIDQTARNTANSSSTLAQGAYNAANTKLATSGGTITGTLTVDGSAGITGNLSVTNTLTVSNIVLPEIFTTQNTRMSIIEGVNTSQNTRMSIIEGVDADQNARVTIIEGVNTTQNTNITTANTPAGTDTQIQFNDGGIRAGNANLTFNKTTGTFSTKQINVTFSEGDEGGEISLAKPISNTSLAGTGVIIDIYQNKIRFFEQGGSTRGAYIDLTSTSGGVSTDLLAGGGGGGSGIDQFARDTANGANGLAQGAYQHANSGFNHANASFSAANNKLNSSGGTITGSLVVEGQANVYQRLSVGTGAFQVLPNLIAQFTGTSNENVQVNIQNLNANGSGDFVVTSDTGTDSAYYVDLGKAGSEYVIEGPTGIIKPLDSFLIAQGNDGTRPGSNLIIAATTATYGDIVFVQGGLDETDEVARFVKDEGLLIKLPRSSISNSTGSLVVQGGLGVQGNVHSSNVFVNGLNVLSYTQAAFNQANTGAADQYARSTANNAYSAANAANVLAQSAFNEANNKLNLSGGTLTGSLTLSANSDLTVTGNLIVLGNTFSVLTETLEVIDPIIQLAVGNYATDALDIGFIAHYNDTANAHTGLIRDHTTKEWYLFEGYTPEISGNNEININNASFGLANIHFDTVFASYGNVSNNLNVTGDLTACSNLFVDGVGNVKDKITELEGINSTQNTNISIIANTAQAAFNQANTGGGGGGVTILTSNSTNRITQNTTTGHVAIDLASSGVVAGTYSHPSLIVDAYGRVTSATTQTVVSAFNTRNGNVTLTATDVTDALSYTPYNAANTIIDQFARDTANSKLATAGGTVTGTLTVQGDFGVQGNLTVSNISVVNTLQAQNTTILNLQSVDIYQNTVIQTAFDKANAANILAQAAFEYANTLSGGGGGGGTTDQYARDKANSAYDYANTIQSGTVINSNTSLSMNVLTANAITITGPGNTLVLDGSNTLTIVSWSETASNPTIATNTITLNLSTATVFNVALTSTISTINITNPAPAGRVTSFVLILEYNGISHSVSWPASVRWPSAVAPTLTGTNGKRDIFTFFTYDGGTSYNAAISSQNI